jgi:hypothetical protein
VAICEYCNKEMSVKRAKGCSVINVRYGDGIVYPRLAYRGEGYCHDCNVKYGQLHHPGCDMERCPRCGGQVISCCCS